MNASSFHARKAGDMRQKRRRMTLLLLALMLSLTAGSQPIIPLQGTRLDVDVFGNLYIIDGEKCTLTVLDTTFAVRGEVGGPGWGPGEFDRPEGIWARNGLDLYVADYGNHRIQRFDRALAFVSSLSGREEDGSTVRFGFPRDVALSRMGDLLVVDGENSCIVKINGLSKVERVFGGFDAGSGKLNQPSRIAVGPSDRVYVLDGPRILVYDAFGNFLSSLYESMWKAPAALSADEERVVVADEGVLFWFGPDHELLGQRSLHRETGSIGGVRDIAYNGGTLFLLGDRGLAVLADPFARGDTD